MADEAPQTEQTQTAKAEIHPAVGVADGGVSNNEKVVYERDKDGNVTGWHKEPLTLADKVAAGEAEQAKEHADG